MDNDFSKKPNKSKKKRRKKKKKAASINSEEKNVTFKGAIEAPKYDVSKLKNTVGLYHPINPKTNKRRRSFFS